MWNINVVTSPILANIASLNVISEIKEKLNDLFQSVETENQTKSKSLHLQYMQMIFR